MSNQNPGTWAPPPTQTQPYPAVPEASVPQAHPVATQPSSPTQGRSTKANHRWVLPTVTGVIGLVIGSALASGGNDPSSAQAAPATTVTVTQPAKNNAAALDTRSAKLDQREKDVAAREARIKQAESARAATQAKETITDDGTFLVGADILPGQYRNTGGDTCYWARLKSTDGSLDSILANNLSGGQAIVTIKKSDKAFETRDCGTWQRIK